MNRKRELEVEIETQRQEQQIKEKDEESDRRGRVAGWRVQKRSEYADEQTAAEKETDRRITAYI